MPGAAAHTAVMSTPPPLPAPPSRPSSPRDAAQGFVNGLAWITLVLGALGVASGLLQMLPSAAMTDASFQRLLDPLGTGQVRVPPMLLWAMEHNLQISLAGIGLSAPMLWLGWGLLRRVEWARVGFIAYLAIGTLMTFGLVWLVPAMVDALLSMQVGLQTPGQRLPPELAGMKTTATAFSAVIALVFAGLHGGIAWKLSTPAVRAQFRPTA